MSKYTTELRFICESLTGNNESVGRNGIKEIITNAAPLIFDFEFPIFDEDYRLPLEIKILRHFYTREICEETFGLWKLRLEDRLNLIMPYYNQLYKSELLNFNPLYDVDLHKEWENEKSGSENNTENETQNVSGNATKMKTNAIDTDKSETATTSGEAEATSSKTGSGAITNNGTQWDLYSDTPQGGINGITNDNDSVSNNTYLTNARKNTNNSTENSSTTESAHNEETTHVTNTKTNAIDTHETGNEQATNSSTKTANSTANKTIATSEDYTEHVYGKRGGISYSKMLADFRATFLNIDKMVLDEMNDLFFGLWN